MFISERMNKQIVVCLHSRILLISEEEWHTDICDHMEESQKHYTELEKPDMRVYIKLLRLYESL